MRFSALAAALVAVPLLAAADLTVGAGATVNLGTGTLDLGCRSLSAAGSFGAGGGTLVQALDVTIPNNARSSWNRRVAAKASRPCRVARNHRIRPSTSRSSRICTRPFSRRRRRPV